MFKRANRGALPAMLVLGVLIGAGLAVASPSRPNRALPSASPPVAAHPGAPGDDGGARQNPHAPRHVNALDNGPGGRGKLGGESAHPGVAAESGGSDGTGSGGSDGTEGSGGSSGSSGSSGSGGADTGPGGSGGGGSGGSDSTGLGKDNNGKAKGRHDGKGNNG